MNSNKIMDFSIKIYRNLLNTLIENTYDFYTLESFINYTEKNKKLIIVRHDVDKKPQNSLVKAKIEAEFGVSTTYYFRCVPQSYDEQIIQEIAELGHEIGYHYEDLSLTASRLKIKDKRKKIDQEKLFEEAIKSFEKNLEKLRKFYPVKTICMHGSPLSRWDNKDIWKKYNYRDYGIIAEPYLDVDFNEVFYITDTGRSWNNKSVSIRDKVQSDFVNDYSSTNEIINAINNGTFPKKVMINTHPQRWSDNYFEWGKEYITQKAKNIIKQLIIKN